MSANVLQTARVHWQVPVLFYLHYSRIKEVRKSGHVVYSSQKDHLFSDLKSLSINRWFKITHQTPGPPRNPTGTPVWTAILELWQYINNWNAERFTFVAWNPSHSSAYDGNDNFGRQEKCFFLILIFYQAYHYSGYPVCFYFRWNYFEDGC